MTKLDQLGAREQNDQNLYNHELADYYTQLQQKGDAYNAAYAQDYGQYRDYLNRLDTLYGYYAAQEQQAASRKQEKFNRTMKVLGFLGDVVQLAITAPRAWARWRAIWPTAAITGRPVSGPMRTAGPIPPGSSR